MPEKQQETTLAIAHYFYDELVSGYGDVSQVSEIMILPGNTVLVSVKLTCGENCYITCGKSYLRLNFFSNGSILPKGGDMEYFDYDSDFAGVMLAKIGEWIISYD